MNNRGMNFAAQKVGQFGFVYVQISADEQHDITVVRIFLIDNCFAALFFGRAQKFADVLDGVDIGSMNQLQWTRNFIPVVFLQ